MWKVYRHIRLDKNEPFYIGITNSKYRPTEKKQRSIAWKRIVNKTEYEIEILMEGLTWQEACDKEREFISLYGRRDKNKGTLVNMTDGGDGTPGRILSKEHKIELSKLRKGIKFTEEHKHKLSIAKIKSEDQKYKRPKKPPRGHHLIGKIPHNAIKIKEIKTGKIFNSFVEYMNEYKLKSNKKIYTKIKRGEIIKIT